MRHTRVLITLLPVALLSAACASGGKAGTSANSVAATRGSRYLVTEEELAGVGDRSAYEALQQLRPTFLRSRDPQTINNPNPAPIGVFVDGGRTEGLDALKRIRASTVKEMRFFEPQDANTRFGTGHNGGVIAVVLK
jgi:hypothetical protein